MRALGLDLGTKTLGIAISDSLKIIASGIENFLYSNNDFYECINQIKKIFDKYQNDIDTIVLGYPLNINGTKNERTLFVEDFHKKLNNVFPKMKIILSDERYTTRIATGMLKNYSLKNSQIKKVKDKMSAIVILQSWLDLKY